MPLSDYCPSQGRDEQEGDEQEEEETMVCGEEGEKEGTEKEVRRTRRERSDSRDLLFPLFLSHFFIMIMCTREYKLNRLFLIIRVERVI